ncbi:MAG: beta-ketoacyl-ACP synthase III [Clostridiaceae bacterium]|nr:beta-ketoacyl-ACP synthase III [Clostridiaceae bacterium]
MAQLKMTGTGSYLPDLIVTNDMMAQIVDTSDKWITSRTGISERRLSAGEPTWYMAAQAAQRALSAAGLEAAALDVILVTTVTPDYFLPSTACILQAELGADHAFCLDVNAACTGFVYALDLANRYLQDPKIAHVLLVSAENLSKLVDFKDRSTCVLFGDGASAIVCSRSAEDESSAVLATRLGAEGKNGRCLVSRALQISHPFMNPDSVWPDRFGEQKNHFVQMEGQEVFKFAVRVLADSLLDVAGQAGLALEDLAFIIPHQANSRIVEAAARRMKVDPGLMVSRMSDFGNTSSASIPICLDELICSGRLKRGDKVAVCGFGAGLTYGAAIFVY